MDKRIGYKKVNIELQAVGQPEDILQYTGWTRGKTRGADQLLEGAPDRAWIRIRSIQGPAAADGILIWSDSLAVGQRINFTQPECPLYVTPPECPPLDLRDVKQRPRIATTFAIAALTFEVEFFYPLED